MFVKREDGWSENVMGHTWVTEDEGNSASGRPQHRRSDGFDYCPRRHEIVVLLPNSYFYSFLKHKILFYWNMKHESIYLFMKF